MYHLLRFASLGEILELDHKTASEALEVTPANYRKRLSRARSQITDLMQRRCGLFDPTNPCRCRRRLRTAIELGRVDPDHLLFASSRETARLFPEVLAEIRSLDELERAAALYRSHSYAPSSIDIVAWLKSILEGTGDGLVVVRVTRISRAFREPRRCAAGSRAAECLHGG